MSLLDGFFADRPSQVRRVAMKLAKRARRKDAGTGTRKPLRRHYRKPKLQKLIAYDFETTRIQVGTPRPLYLTAFGEGGAFMVSARVRDLFDVRDVLEARFLTPENNGARFVARNGNKFDVRIVCASLLHSEEYLLRPYLTSKQSLRGVRVVNKDTGHEWEFLDGMSMTGIQKSLAKFLEVFAPDHLKLDAPNWEKEEFNADNPEHVAYAMRDSEGLWHGLQNAQKILQSNFEQCLQPTIGNLGIRIFQANMPNDVAVWPLPNNVDDIVRDYVMRGGYCYSAKRYRGPVWKYDINQAYAAAMRDCTLPQGKCMESARFSEYVPGIYKVNARNHKNKVPFYCRDKEGRSLFALHEMSEVWLTSDEVRQLWAEGWIVQILQGYKWEQGFTMRDFVNRLEDLRMNGPGGPKGAQGEMMKAIGNNSYGKTVERLDGLELVLSLNRPDGFSRYQNADDTFQHVWFKIGEPQMREYHQPQIGAFITSHVRMVLRRAILKNPDEWIYADTDCVAFSEPVDLPIDSGKYGKWKIEATGEEYIFITKKVYAKADGKEKKAKGLNIKPLTVHDFEKWFDGEPPRQRQLQQRNFVATMTGADMFVARTKVGQRL